MLEIKNINIKFDNKECIRDGHFIAYPSSITAIIGESGTGKSSLLYIIGMLSNQEYDYYYHDELLQFNDKQKAEFRNKHISFITQNSLLIDTINVEKNIEFYLMQSDTKYTVDELLEMVKLTDKKKAMPESLSGGERQRVAIACAIAKDSDIILGDEVTSALDEDNKKIIMNIFRKLADQGKTVILVSHERNIIDECDRVYELDHLELKLKKDNKKSEVKEIKKRSKKVNTLKMFELFFHSNRRYNRRRIITCFIVMLILFLSVSIFVYAYKNKNSLNYSNNDVSENKLLVLSDNNQWLRNLDGWIVLRNPNSNDPINQSNLNKMKTIDKIIKVYDYYTFGLDFFNSVGRSNELSIEVKRNGKNIERRESSEEYQIDDYDYSVIPIFPEDKLYSQDDGVYVTNNLAYIYNIEIGDEIEVNLNIPYAMSKSSSDDEEGKYNYFCIGEIANYKTKVIGITEANDINNFIYMKNDIIKQFIDEQVKRYKSGEIKVNADAFYEPIEDLKPYAQAVFVERIENVLKVQKEINDISEDIFAYSEYQTIADIQEILASEKQNSFKITCIGSVVFIIGGAIIEIFYLRKYKITYMVMKLIGYDKREKNKIFILHSLYQILIILCLSMFIYITASLPNIFSYFNIISYEETLKYINEMYNLYMVYCGFSVLHAVIFVSSVISVIVIVNIGIIKYYDKKEIILGIRKR